jgi:hypothetical protein
VIVLRRQLPLLITMVTGLLFAGQYYVPHPASEQLLTSVTKWLQIIGGFALVLGITSLFQLHAAKIRRQEAGWGYSLVLYAGIVVTVLVGLWNGGKETIDGAMTSFGWIYSYTLVPLQGTMFAILAFSIVSCAKPRSGGPTGGRDDRHDGARPARRIYPADQWRSFGLDSQCPERGSPACDSHWCQLGSGGAVAEDHFWSGTVVSGRRAGMRAVNRRSYVL